MLGEVIHGYRVDRALSADKGGFGDVFFATHVDSGAEAVIKVLKPEMSALHALVSGLPGASSPHLPPGGAYAAGAPHLPPGGVTAGATSRSTLGAGAGAVSMMPARKRGLGPWLGVGAMVVVGGAIAAAMATRGGPSSVDATPPTIGLSDASVAMTVAIDAAVVAVVVTDAAPVDRGSGSQQPPIDPAPGKKSRQGERTSSSQAEIAAKLNEEGTEEMYNTHFDTAARKFEDAVARVPEPKYLFNLGTALFQLGRFDEAQRALRTLLASSPSEQLAGNARKLLDRIRDEAKAQGVTLSSDAAPPSTSMPEPARVTPTTAEVERAAKLNEAGKEALYTERYEQGRTLFQRAYSLDPKPQILCNLCLAELQSGRCADARRTCQRVIATWPGDQAAKKAQKLLERMGTCH